MRILGISAFYHDSAAALVEDGEITAAAQEERFTRVKHDSSFPHNAYANFCLKHAGVRLSQVEHVVFYEKPLPKFERLLPRLILSFAPQGFRIFSNGHAGIWIKEKLFPEIVAPKTASPRDPSRTGMDRCCSRSIIRATPPARSFRLPLKTRRSSPWMAWGSGPPRRSPSAGAVNWSFLREIHFPHSLGLLYSAFTYYTGFKVNSGEYKIMGLAPYGEPKYSSQILDHLIEVRPVGSFRMNLEYFNYCVGLTMTNSRFDARCSGGPPRQPDDLIAQKHMDLAASIQTVLEEMWFCG